MWKSTRGFIVFQISYMKYIFNVKTLYKCKNNIHSKMRQRSRQNLRFIQYNEYFQNSQTLNFLGKYYSN